MAKGVGKEPLDAMIREEGSRLRTADGVTVLHDTDARYFPSKWTVKGIVGRAARGRRLHRFDQPAVEEYVKRRQRLHPTEKWFFQPGTEEGQEFLMVHQTPFQQVGGWAKGVGGKGGAKNGDMDKHSHAPSIPQKMLLKYGDTIVGMDATYKVTKWSEQPFFLISVVDNHGHAFPVATFFCEHETGASIAAALKQIRAWNPGWRPAYFMVDKDVKVRAVIIDDQDRPDASFARLPPPFHRPLTYPAPPTFPAPAAATTCPSHPCPDPATDHGISAASATCPEGEGRAVPHCPGPRGDPPGG